METAKLIEAVEVKRDENGNWWHPGMPDFDEDQTAEWKAWIAQQGLQISRSLLEYEREDHPAYVAYFENGDCDFSAWSDEPPEGGGWFTLAIFDTEDGPVWCWASRATTEQKG